MSILKCRNAMIVAPHPAAKSVTVHGVALINEALAELGAPKDLIQIIEQPSMAATRELMAKADVTVATGGGAMGKSARGRVVDGLLAGAGDAIVIAAASNHCSGQESVVVIVVRRHHLDIALSHAEAGPAAGIGGHAGAGNGEGHLRQCRNPGGR